MSLPSPQLWRILPHPAVTGSASLSQNLSVATAALNSRSNLAQCVPTDDRVQTCLTHHPSLPWVAYVLQSSNPSNQILNTLLVVQDLESHQVVWSLHLVDVAATLYGEKNPSKLEAATKSLGNVVALQFLDTSTLYWSGMMATSNTVKSSHYQWLAVQTSLRVVVLQLKQSSYAPAVVLTSQIASSISTIRYTRQTWLVSHLHDKALGVVPSSNLLALDANTWLVGCADGSLKAWDRLTHQPIKSIKGLGKGDWIVHLMAANRYSTLINNKSSSSTAATDGSSSTTPPMIERKRILTVTKKGSVYLIELEIGPGVLEIKPPLARFVGGWSEPTEEAVLEHQLCEYDAQRDWFLWLAPSTKKVPITKLFMWNLEALQTDFMQQQSSKSVFKPDPTLTIQFPAGQDPNMTVLSLTHELFSSQVVTCGVVTQSGEFYLQAAVYNPNNAVTTTIAIPVMGVTLSQVLERDLSLDSPPVIRIQAARTQPLGDRPRVVLSTNVGLVVLDLSAPPTTGARCLHFGAGLGSLGKSVLQVKHSDIVYGSLDTLKTNPIGHMEVKNPLTVFDSPPAVHLPADYHKRPYRLTPVFLPSPSGLYVCLFWQAEFRYEILHLPSVLSRVGRTSGQTTRNPCVASGTGVSGFAWVGDEDDYALIHAEGMMEEAALLLAAAPVLVVPTAEGGLTMAANMNMSDLMDIRKSALGMANLATSATKGTLNLATSATKGTLNLATSATKQTLKAATKATDATLNVTKKATDATLSAATQTMNLTTKAGKTVTKSVSKGVKKSFGIFGKKKKGQDDESGGMTAEDDEEEEGMPNLDNLDLAANMPTIDAMPAQQQAKRYVELRALVAMEASAEMSSGIAHATSSGLGELAVRGGSNRNPPTVIFGGPVLCVASRSEEDRQGHAHFYTRKPGETDNAASTYVSTGPTLPFPDLLTWDDDGRLCAVVIQNRIAVYLSEIPDFVLLGTVRIGTSASATVISAKFVHGVLYCCTWNSVHCVFLGDLQGGVCRLDTYTLASANVTKIPAANLDSETYTSFSPPVVPLPLTQPVILGYQSGSLIVSSARGLHAIPLTHPLLRIGSLLGAGQVERAVKWFDAVPNHDHEALASFVERRGFPHLALQLPGLSLETIIDMSMRYGFVGRLEEAVEDFGVKGLRAIDMGRGFTNGMFGPERDTHSLVVCVGAYLLAHGKVELTRRLATELLRAGEDGKKDALFLSALMLSIDEADATRLMSRAVEDDGKSSDWLVGNFVRDHILSGRDA